MTKRILLVEPAAGDLLHEEVLDYVNRGWKVSLNARRHQDEQVATLRDVPGITFLDFVGSDPDQILKNFSSEGQGFDAIKVRSSTRFDRSFFRAATSELVDRPLRVFGRAASGIDSVDLEAAADYGVVVAHSPGANADAVAEFTLALMLSSVRSLHLHDENVRRGAWSTSNPAIPGRSLSELTVGLIGPGAIGSRVARLVQAFGGRVVALGSSRYSSEVSQRQGVRRVSTLRELLEVSDIVSLHAPLTNSTRHMVDGPVLDRMRPGSILINTARGELVDEIALDAALRDPKGPISFAALDVFEQEGLDSTSPLRSNPFCILSPHIAGMTRSAMAESSSRLCRLIDILIESGTSSSELVQGASSPIWVLKDFDRP